LEFNVPFQNKYGYIRDEQTRWNGVKENMKSFGLSQKDAH